MLGRLARWLRLLGFDTLYYPLIKDSLLLKIAREEKRTLLTRDTRLVKVRGLEDFLLLKENDTFDQLRKVIAMYDLIPDINKLSGTRLLSRCSLCNSVLDDVPREQAKAHVPEYVYLVSENFRHCPQCGKFYWKGTHQDLLEKKLREIIYN